MDIVGGHVKWCACSFDAIIDRLPAGVTFRQGDPEDSSAEVVA
jgi:hypothetical protein